MQISTITIKANKRSINWCLPVLIIYVLRVYYSTRNTHYVYCGGQKSTSCPRRGDSVGIVRYVNYRPFWGAILSGSITWNDAPQPWQLGFQDGASPSIEGIVELHDQIMLYLIIVLIGVGWMLTSTVSNYNSDSNKIIYKYTNHGTLIELIWTITPALVLIAIAFPSFKLLYLLDEVIDPAITVKAIGNQWYWNYEYSDYIGGSGESIEFTSYMIPTEDLEIGQLRLLEVDNRVILPVDTHVRFIVTANDVIHSFALPALGVKIDGIPGRLNQTSVLINREGTFYGQCSEICGVWHGFMPIVVEAVSLPKYYAFIESQLSI
jgi:cytochrome c oxidase subunit 2